MNSTIVSFFSTSQEPSRAGALFDQQRTGTDRRNAHQSDWRLRSHQYGYDLLVHQAAIGDVQRSVDQFCTAAAQPNAASRRRQRYHQFALLERSTLFDCLFVMCLKKKCAFLVLHETKSLLPLPNRFQKHSKARRTAKVS